MADEKPAANDNPKADEIVQAAREAFSEVAEAEAENRKQGLEDTRFARLAEQWPANIRKQREDDGRPCLTINRMTAFIRQVVNDSRQNKPSIKVHPCDSQADPETAKLYDGLIRNIQYVSNADVAYDTAIESAVSGGFGYFRIGMDYSHDDSFDLDISIDRVADPFLIYGDPASKCADSSDWNTAFAVDYMKKDEFAKKYKGAKAVDWDAEGYVAAGDPWLKDDCVMRAEWWTREEVDRPIVLLSDGTVLDAERMQDPELVGYFLANGITVVNERTAKCWKVRQRILTGAEMLEDNEWPGKYIPIIPVYGDEVVVDGKRVLRSLIRDAKDPQRMFNYWRTTATEMVALAPKAPYIGAKGSFVTDAAKWATANSESHAYIEYDPQPGGPPQRQPFAGVPAGAIQEALNASDDMKAIMGIYDASLGARSNETSGRAIVARDRQSDVSTFHFLDNMTRAIRHAGRIIIDLIPHVYNKERVIRVIGEDGTTDHQPLGKPVPVMGPDGQQKVDPKTGEPMVKVYDLAVGKYDLTVATGPSYTTKRQESADQMMELMRTFPQAAPVVGDVLAKNLDWPGADEIAERLKALYQKNFGQSEQAIPPEVQGMIQQGQQVIQQLQQSNQQLQMENQKLQQKMAIEAGKLQLGAHKQEIEQFRAETDRMTAEANVVHRSMSPPVRATF